MPPFFRRLFVVGLFALSALHAFAQIAPEIATGTAVAEVIKVYGWPNGKSMAANREVWIYDGFQVALQNDRVVNVWPIPPDERQTKRQRALPLDVRKTSNVAPRSTTATNLPPKVSLRNPAQSVPAKTTLDKHEPTVSRQAVPKAVEKGGVRVVDLWPVLAIGCVVLIGGIIYSSNRRIASEVAQMTGAPSSSPPSTPKTWQESVAESVARTQSDGSATHAGSSATAREDTVSTASTSGAGPTANRTHTSIVPLPLTELSYELLDRLEWKRLELITALYFAKTGVRAECTCIGADGGIDVKLYRPGAQDPYCYVQCKAMSWKVDVKLVRELCGVMALGKVAEGIFITTGRYSRDALSFAAKTNIRTIDGHGFVALFNRLPRDARVEVLAKVTEGDYTTPTCSRCDIKMVLKDTTPPVWNCRRCNQRQNIRNPRLAALRAARR